MLWNPSNQAAEDLVRFGLKWYSSKLKQKEKWGTLEQYRDWNAKRLHGFK